VGPAGAAVVPLTDQRGEVATQREGRRPLGV